MKDSRIKILSQNLINKIAAGEVIVRPASVVKELVENSLDAAASDVVIEVSEDTRDISVVDNGNGMTPDEIPLSLERHATSKIASLDDVINIQTRGFRGEALPSIAAVSRLSIISRTKESLAGCRLVVEGGEITENKSMGTPEGTRVEVHDLFFNTPARLKFMRRPATEMKRILETVTSQALSHPEVGFTFFGKGKKMLELPSGQTLEGRIRQVMGSSVEGALLPLQSGDMPITISGYIAKPSASRKTRDGQYFFVNRRPISNRMLTATFEQAYRGMIMTGIHPVGVIFLFLEGGEVDVNVHPTKEEVRFQDERKVGGLLHRVVRNALENANLIPEAQIPESEQKETPGGASLPGIFSTPREAVFDAFRRKEAQRQSNLDFSYPPSGKTREHRDSFSMPIPGNISEIVKSPPSRLIHDSTDELWDYIKEAHPVGQIDFTYIAALCPDALLLIDQHAAHERVMYEMIVSRKTRTGSQSLLLPVNFEVELPQVADMERLKEPLESFGMEVESFGGQSYVVHSVPADLAEIDVAALVRDILEAPDIDFSKNAVEEIRDKIAIRMACHGAIRAGQRLSKDEMIALIDELSHTRLAFTCPHGRPTMILFTKAQLDRQFKRTK